jgi:hypothetical protein
MKNRSLVVKTISSVSAKCKNKAFIDAQILHYKNSTENAVKHILEMAKTVQLLHSKYGNKEVNSADIEYFCMSVNLKRNSSQYRKFICIGKHAEKLQQYMTELPQTISVLYEITTLSSEVFEELIESNQIKPNLTLGQLKRIACKPATRKKVKSDIAESMTLNFDFDNISESTKKVIFQFYAKLKSCTDVAIILPKDDALSEYLSTVNDDDEVIDAAFRTIQEPALV